MPTHARSTSVLIAGAIACASIAAALAQGTQPTQTVANQQRQQNASQSASQSKARLTVPIIATVAAQTINGTFAIHRFARTTNNGVAAVGILTLSVTDAKSDASRAIITRTTLPVTIADRAATTTAAATQTCQSLGLVLGSIEIDPVGVAVQTNPVNVDVAAALPSTTSDQRFNSQLCQVADLNQGAGPADLATALNTLLEMIG